MSELEVFLVTDERNLEAVAGLMVRLKPEWWDHEGAIEQLGSGICWYAKSEDGYPIGWILARYIAAYKTMEIECLGYDGKGEMLIGAELNDLIEAYENFARQLGAVNSRFTIGSRGLSCHGKSLEKLSHELDNIAVSDRLEYNWFLSRGYEAAGILPNIYGFGYHGIMLLKRL